MRFWTVFLFVLLTVKFASSQSVKREVRGTWISTVSNLDWPSSRSLNPSQQRAELVTMLDQLKAAGMNTIYFQVRSQCDATYISSIEPWADIFSTANAGVGPNPVYDPLQFVIEECRKRSVEIHAWFNPYRAVSNFNNINNFSTTHIARTRPEWLLAQGTLRILDPGIPDVPNYIIRVVMDVLRRYDVDGIHYDDYFYPYPPSGSIAPFNDDATFATHSRGFPNTITGRNDWRRANIDTLIKRTYDSVRAVKPWVKFGVSPFGIWANASSVSGGSATNGLQSFSAIYADSRNWMQNDWIDYMVPQLYWSIGFNAANYSVLVPWWNALGGRRHIYSGMAAYKVNADADVNWNDPNQIPAQIRLNRANNNFSGSVFFRARSITTNPNGVRDSLASRYFASPALLPQMSWKDDVAPPAPMNVIGTVVGNTVRLNWTAPSTTQDDLSKVRQYVVYRSLQNPVNTSDASSIRWILPADSTQFEETVPVGNTYFYTITALDRLHNESVVSNVFTASVFLTAINPINTESDLRLQVSPNPLTSIAQVQYRIPAAGEVELRITDLNGRLISSYPQGFRSVGLHQTPLQVAQLKQGVYYISLITKNKVVTVAIVKQ